VNTISSPLYSFPTTPNIPKAGTRPSWNIQLTKFLVE
jgi:hypothetical protein